MAYELPLQSCSQRKVSTAVLHGNNFTLNLTVIKAEEKQDTGLKLNSLSSPPDYFLKEMLKKKEKRKENPANVISVFVTELSLIQSCITRGGNCKLAIKP